MFRPFCWKEERLGAKKMCAPLKPRESQAIQERGDKCVAQIFLVRVEVTESNSEIS